MRILVVSSFLPYPLDSGGHVRLFNLLTYLAKKHEVTLVCEMRPYQTEQDLSEVGKICKHVYPVLRRKQWSAVNITKAVIGPDSFLVTGHTNPLMQEKLKHLLGHEAFDLVHIETFYVSQNLPKDVSLPVVLIEHNIEYEVYKKYAKKALLLLHPGLSRDVSKLKKREEQAWQKANIVVAVSEPERLVIAGIAKKTAVVPNGVSLAVFPMKKEISDGKKKLLFIGNFKWLQNRDSALWLLKEVWPRLRDRDDMVLWIVGRHIPDNIRAFASERVKIDADQMENTSEIFRSSYLLLAPIWVGGGTSYKILESMASGTPVITTPLGLEGIEAKAGQDLLVSETGVGFSEQIEMLCSDMKKYTVLSENGRLIVEKKYAWDKIGAMLENVYTEAVNGTKN